MKIIKAKVAGSDTLYIIKRAGLFKKEVYWVSQNYAIPVLNIASVPEVDDEVDTEKMQEQADAKRDEMREDGIAK